MPHIVADRVKDTTATTGTGAVTLSGSAPAGYRTFGSVLVSTTDTVPYAIVGQTGEWEVGIGSMSNAANTTLNRTTVLSSSNANALVNFSAGAKDVFISIPAAAVPRSTAITANSASITTTATTIASFTQNDGPILGDTILRFTAVLNAINTATATNLVAAIRVNGVTLATLTQALGTTANASPGRPVLLDGLINFRAITSGLGSIRAFASGAVAFDAWAASTAPATWTVVSGEITADVQVSVSGATSSLIATQAIFEKVR